MVRIPRRRDGDEEVGTKRCSLLRAAPAAALLALCGGLLLALGARASRLDELLGAKLALHIYVCVHVHMHIYIYMANSRCRGR